jgi:hypothetical protein
MLRLLLDEHFPPRIIRQFLRKCPGAGIDSVLDWKGGTLKGSSDEVLLTEAHRHGLTVVTYDQATIVPLLKMWGEQGVPHGGVILIDERTIRQDDFGGISRALARLWEEERESDWFNRVIYLTRAVGK